VGKKPPRYISRKYREERDKKPSTIEEHQTKRWIISSLKLKKNKKKKKKELIQKHPLTGQHFSKLNKGQETFWTYLSLVS
jgi:ureidoglycolate hydrolase